MTKRTKTRAGLPSGLAASAVLGVALLAVGLAGCASSWLPAAIVDAPNQGKPVKKLKAEETESRVPVRVDRHFRVEVGPPPASLSAWVMEPTGLATPRGTVVVLHGLTSGKRDMGPTGARLAADGYRAVLVDLRGQGGSTGAYVTFGVRDGGDLVQLLDALEAEGLVDGGVAAFGPSYGGAAALQWAARDPRLDAVIVVATFRSLREVVPGFVQRFVPVIGGSIDAAEIDRAVTRAGERAGFDADDADSVDAIARARCPVLIVHGTADEHIPVSHAEALAAAAPGRARLVLVDGADHDTVMTDATGVLRRETRAWLEAHVAR